ncbi:MAG TPA: hypothetical protein VGN85_08700 [Methyloceanibacter sp.]|jgi:hypothetical protein|nr:hypothetical protein [Methyloceanibacter sp.]
MEGGDALVSARQQKANLDQNSSGTLPEIAEAGSEIFSSPVCSDYFGG